MRGVLKVFATAALMVVLIATAVTPAFAAAGGANNWRDNNDEKWGWQCGTKKHDPVYYCNSHD